MKDEVEAPAGASAAGDAGTGDAVAAHVAEIPTTMAAEGPTPPLAAPAVGTQPLSPIARIVLAAVLAVIAVLGWIMLSQ